MIRRRQPLGHPCSRSRAPANFRSCQLFWQEHVSRSSRRHTERCKSIAHIGQQASCRRRQRSGAACNEPKLCLCANGMIDICMTTSPRATSVAAATPAPRIVTPCVALTYRRKAATELLRNAGRNFTCSEYSSASTNWLTP